MEAQFNTKTLLAVAVAALLPARQKRLPSLWKIVKSPIPLPQRMRTLLPKQPW